MRVLVLFAHPVETSFNAALHATVVERLEAAGHDVDDCDLYREDFEPRLSRAERLAYHDTAHNAADVRAHVDRLMRAEALVLCYPVWNFGFPAILKGYVDRVFLPGVSFTLEDGAVKPALTHIAKLCAVTTYGATRWRATLAGDPPRRLVTRVLRAVTGSGTDCRYHALYDMNRAEAGRRKRFLARVAAAMERL